MSGHFEVIFSGEIYAAVDPVKVRSDMARIFKQPAEKVHQLFDGRTWVLKDGLDRPTAERYQVELAKIGVISEIRDKAPKYESAKSSDPNSKSQNFTLEKVAITKMKCPECQYEQLEADYCARCGVNIAVAEAKAKLRAQEDEVIQERIQQLRERRAKGELAGATVAGPGAPPAGRGAAVPPAADGEIDRTVPDAAASAAMDRTVPEAAPRAPLPGPVQESTVEFHGAPTRTGPSPALLVGGTVVAIVAVVGVLVALGVLSFNV